MSEDRFFTCEEKGKAVSLQQHATGTHVLHTSFPPRDFTYTVCIHPIFIVTNDYSSIKRWVWLTGQKPCWIFCISFSSDMKWMAKVMEVLGSSQVTPDAVLSYVPTTVCCCHLRLIFLSSPSSPPSCSLLASFYFSSFSQSLPTWPKLSWNLRSHLCWDQDVPLCLLLLFFFFLTII